MRDITQLSTDDALKMATKFLVWSCSYDPSWNIIIDSYQDLYTPGSKRIWIVARDNNADRPNLYNDNGMLEFLEFEKLSDAFNCAFEWAERYKWLLGNSNSIEDFYRIDWQSPHNFKGVNYVHMPFKEFLEMKISESAESETNGL
jgi:hypothetical protein